MENADYIESYFNNDLPAAEKEQFEQKIIADAAFAEEVAFYYSAWQTAKNELAEDKKKRFAEIYQQNISIQKQGITIKLWKYAVAAAVVTGIIFGSYLYIKPVSPKQLADQYIQQHLQSLSITMSSQGNSIQDGLKLYNEGKWPQALQQFEKIISSDTLNFNAKKYAGIVFLKLKQYDSAIVYFTQLQKYTKLYFNPAAFYLALALMERNQPGDAVQAKQLLENVVQNNSEGKEVAQEWLKKL